MPPHRAVGQPAPAAKQVSKSRSPASLYLPISLWALSARTLPAAAFSGSRGSLVEPPGTRQLLVETSARKSRTAAARRSSTPTTRLSTNVSNLSRGSTGIYETHRFHAGSIPPYFPCVNYSAMPCRSCSSNGVLVRVTRDACGAEVVEGEVE